MSSRSRSRRIRIPSPRDLGLAGLAVVVMAFAGFMLRTPEVVDVVAARPTASPSATPGLAKPARFVPFGDSVTFNAQSWARQVCGDRKLVICPAIAGHPQVDTGGLVPFIASEVLPLKAEYVTIMAGTNDLYSETTVEQTVANLRSMVKQLQAADVKPILCTIVPSDDRATEVAPMNAAIRALAEQEQIPLLDLYDTVGATDGTYLPGMTGDGVHPNRDGSDRMAEEAVRVFRDLLNPQ